jgi:hypothetical protein
VTLLLVISLAVAACAGSPAPGASGTASAGTAGSPTPVGTDPIAVGPLTLEPLAIDPAADGPRGLAALDREDRARVRTQAGFPGEVGTGWDALSTSIDEAIDAAVGTIGDDLGVDVPTAARPRLIASIGAPVRPEPVAESSAASAMAIVTAAMTAGAALGSGGTKETSATETKTVTDGDDVATITVKAKGKVASTGSRVVADFTFDITGNVTNSVSGATAQMTGTATAHVEIDGCPDANGSSKGKVSLTSRESVTGQHDGGEGTASWTRDLTGDFDIGVDDQANISGLVLDANAQESGTTSEREAGDNEAETDGHDLGVTMHWEYKSGPGFDGLAPVMDKTDGDLTHQTNATKAHLLPLVKSANYAISVAAVALGRAAEAFWRDGKCVELIVDPDGGDVEADSMTDVVAKVKHRFEGNELDKPVEAKLTGVKLVDPANEKQPAPATVKYTAGSEDGDVGNIAFESVSNRGIAKKTVKFTVRPAVWDVTFTGTDNETFAPVVSNSFTADITDLTIQSVDGTLTGTGKMHLRGTVTSGPCTGGLDQVATVTVTGTLVGTGPEAKLKIIMRASSPGGDVTRMRCKPSGGADIPAEGYAERFGDPLQEFELPAAGGTVQVNKTRGIGGSNMMVTVKGTFTVTRGKVTPG